MKLKEEGEMSMYTSGSFGTENPSEKAYKSVMLANHFDPYAVKVFVSIGTGRSLQAELIPSVGSRFHIFNRMVELTKLTFSLSTASSKIFKRNVRATENNTICFRLDVEPGLNIRAFDPLVGKKGDETLKLMRTKTEEYLQSPDVKRDIAEIARQLVDIRRQRSIWEPDLDRWERFCHGVEYACPVSTCKDDAKRYKTRRGLQAHLKAAHSIDPDKLETLLDAGKRYPLDEVHE